MIRAPRSPATAAALRGYVQTLDLGRVLEDPFQMKTGPNLPGRAPDFIYVSKRNLNRLRKLYLHGPADLAVEVVSPSSRNIDRVDKHREYERGGVREYWLIDPERRAADFYVLGRGKIYRLTPVDDDGVFHSTVLKGFWIKTDWLWEKSGPDPVKILKQFGVI